MDFRQCGRSGPTVSVVGLGCNNFGGRIGLDQARAVVDAAVDEGITLFDTADIYGNLGGSETILGDVLQGRRDRVVLATKFGMDMGGGPDEARGSRRYIRKAIEASLRRLNTEFVDLYQLHAPDPKTPIDETLAALDDLVVEGKVRYLGSSNLAAWQVVDADWIARTGHLSRFVSAQNEYNLLRRSVETELVPACLQLGIGVLPFFPLASGLLTGKYRRGQGSPEGTRLASLPGRLERAPFDTLEALEGFARERGVSLLDVAIGGLASRPAVASVIAGATRPEQVRANVAAGAWVPTDDDRAALDKVLAA